MKDPFGNIAKALDLPPQPQETVLDKVPSKKEIKRTREEVLDGDFSDARKKHKRINLKWNGCSRWYYASSIS